MMPLPPKVAKDYALPDGIDLMDTYKAVLNPPDEKYVRGLIGLDDAAAVAEIPADEGGLGGVDELPF
jgi:hypothetical protein